ncbi:MAG: hypothetical protein J7K98_00585 [Candidatus Aenigmarchaeota archaeon]|nr:hypothetical protein [Candidatus Aenigmarchaeota archaeon]
MDLLVSKIESMLLKSSKKRWDEVMLSIFQYFSLQFAIVLILAKGLDVGTVLATGFLGILFFYVDIVGLDGGAVYGLAKVFGGKGRFEEHVSTISSWKLPLLVFQLTSLILANSYSIFFFVFVSLLVVEAFLFILTIKVIHRIEWKKSCLTIGIVFSVLIVLMARVELISKVLQNLL